MKADDRIILFILILTLFTILMAMSYNQGFFAGKEALVCSQEEQS